MRAFTLAATLTMTIAACTGSDSDARDQPRRVSAEEARGLLVDRNWLDRMPESHRDRLHVLRFTPSMGGGVYQDRTLFRGSFELFRFEATGDELRVHLPETREKLRTRYRIESVSGPAPFDLRLTLDRSPRGPAVYYGIRAETDRSGAALEARLDAVAAALAD